MASITFDTELMVNHIAATPAKPGSAFTTVLEPKSRRPAVISLSNENPPVLELIKVLVVHSMSYLPHRITASRRTMLATAT